MRTIVMTLACTIALGCGEPIGLKQAPTTVSGKVTAGGRPVGNVALVLQPLDHGHQKTLPVNPDGTFQGELIAGTYAYSLAPSPRANSVSALRAIGPQYLEADLQRTIAVEPGQGIEIALD
ncbi:MAG: hypothetical protein KF847_03945 [Pirellulales bacterium]|nr:hypothetical protein [Pirellulales bacterium]